MHISEPMDSLNSAQLCRLCMQSSHELVNIWKTFQDSNIATILAKHFWFQVNKNDGLTEWLCQMCWTQTKTFHQFYERVEQFQKCYWDSVKSNDEPAASDVKDANLESDLIEIKCEETELTSQVVDSQIYEEDEFDDSNAEPQESNDKSLASDPQTSNGTSHRDLQTSNDGKWKVSIKRKVTSSSSRSDKLINKQIKEEQNRELNGQLREWFTMKCDLCNDDEFDTWLGVKRHYRNVHQMIGYLKCCDRKFHRRYELLAHIRQHIIAPESIKLNAQIREYFNMKCDICPDVTFLSWDDVKQHYHDAHQIQGFLTCCNKKFHERYSVIAHIRNHTNPDEHRCGQCEKSFQTKKALRYHIERHLPLDSRAFKCNLCSSSFTKATRLKAHIQHTHTSKNGDKFPCEKCNKNYRSKVSLKHHIRQVHEAPLNYICEVCAHQFKSEPALREHVICEHLTTPEDKVQCDICGKWYKNKTCVMRHLREHRRDKRPVQCPICKKSLMNKNKLDTHIRCTHAEKTHRCTLCDKAFWRAKVLREHVAAIHTGEDLYKCKYCERKFKSNANMYSHQKKAHLAEWTRDKERKQLLIFSE